MLTSDRARLKISDFHRYYILMGPNTRWDNANKDTTMFPAFNASDRPDADGGDREVLRRGRLVQEGDVPGPVPQPDGVRDDGDGAALRPAASGFTDRLKETTLDANQRPGFLTRVGFLNAYAAYNRTSPIHRGAFIMKQVLGTPIGTPPPGAEATALPPASADLNTNRKQVDAQTTGGVCESLPPRLHQPGRLLDGGRSTPSAPGRRRRSVERRAIDTTARHGHRRHDGPRHQRVRSDDEDRRLADGAAPLRRAAGPRSRTSAKATRSTAAR